MLKFKRTKIKALALSDLNLVVGAYGS